MRTLCVALCLILLAIGASAQPLLTAWRAQAPPSIDGDLSDACWQAASVTSPFISAEAPELPLAQTQARLCWDDTNLYVAIEAFDRFLEPKLNALDRVRAETSGPDARVFSDDAVEVFLQPPGMDHYFHFAANSGDGTLEKTSIDREWDTQWECAARRGTGSYVVEMAIPLAALDAETEGEWRANFARERTAVPELSTWSGLQGKFHQPEQFGTLRFGEAGPALSAIEMAARGRSHALTGEIVGGEDATWEATVTAGDATRTASAEGPGRHTLTVEVPEEAFEVGAYEVSYALKAGDEVVLQSPAMPHRVAAALVQFDLQTDNADATAYLNGAPVEPADGALLQLGQGINYLAVEASADGPNPGLRPVLEAAGHAVDPTWLVAPADAEDWRQSVTGQGLVEASAGDDGVLWSGAGADDARLVCALYAGPEEAQLFPPNNTYRFPRGSSQIIRPWVHAPMGVPMDGYRMVVEVPDVLEYVAVEPVSGGSPTVTKARTFEHNAQTMARYYITWEHVPHEGMELSMRWGTANDSPAHYQPTIQATGTYDWHHATYTVTAYPGCASVSPVLMKWGNRGITGTMWVDNLVIHREGDDADLLGIGDFEGETWADNSRIKTEGPDGSNCAKLVSTPANANKADAVWFGTGIPVEVGERYVVEMDLKCEEIGSETTRTILGLLFRAPADAPEQQFPMYTYFQSLDGAVTEVPVESTLVMLPELKNVRPDGVRILPCYTAQWLYNPDAVEAIADNAWASGMTWFYGWRDNNLFPHLVPRGAKVWWVLGWEEFSARYGRHGGVLTPVAEAFMAEHPEVHAVNFEGERLEEIVCPTWLLEDGEPIIGELERQILEVINSSTIDAVNWDVEHAVIDPPTFCTCDRCLAAFREFEGLAADEPLSPQVLLEQYPDEWTNFRCTQNAQMAGKLREIVRKADRPVEFSVYSGYESERTQKHYGVDWALMAQNIDLGIAGYQGDYTRVRATVEAMGDTPLLGSERWYRFHDQYWGPGPDELAYRNRILRQFVQSGCHGVLIWQITAMTGGGFYAVSEATQIMDQYADYFHEDQRCDERVTVRGLYPFDWAAFEHDGTVLVLLMDLSGEARQVEMTVDGRAQTVRMEPYETVLREIQ